MGILRMCRIYYMGIYAKVRNHREYKELWEIYKNGVLCENMELWGIKGLWQYAKLGIKGDTGELIAIFHY